MIAALLLRLWKPLAAVAAVAGLLSAVWIAGFQTAAKRCHEAEARAEIVALKRDLAVAQEAAAQADAMGRDLAAANDKLEKENADAASQRPPAPDCHYSAADLDWMRHNGRH